MATAFDKSAKFFRIPFETKMKHCWTTPEANRGYSAPGREKVSLLTSTDEVDKVRQEAPDLKESFEIGREGEEGHPNLWPDEEGELVGFKDFMIEFFGKCKKVHEEVMRAIAVAMGLDETVSPSRSFTAALLVHLSISGSSAGSVL